MKPSEQARARGRLEENPGATRRTVGPGVRYCWAFSCDRATRGDELPDVYEVYPISDPVRTLVPAGVVLRTALLADPHVYLDESESGDPNSWDP